MGAALSLDEFWEAHDVSDCPALPDFSDDVTDPLLRGVNTYRSYCYLSTRGRQLLARVRSSEAAVAVAEAAWSAAEAVEIRLRDFSGKLVPHGKERLRIMQSLRDMEALAEEFYAVFEQYGEKPPLALWALRVSRPTWYNIHVETNPGSMDRPGETSQEVAPQGSQPELERQPNAEGVVVSTRERLAAAEEEVRRLRALRLEELSRVYVELPAYSVDRQATEVRRLLDSERQLILVAGDASGSMAILTSWLPNVKAGRDIAWNKFRPLASAEVLQLAEHGESLGITYRGKPYALLQALSAEAKEYLSITAST